MEFDFAVGKDERHQVRFSYSKFWGTKLIAVDNRTVKKRSITAFLYLLIIVFAVSLPFYRHIYLWYTTVAGPSIVEIFLYLVILVIIVLVVDLLPISVIVGENEKHEVKIQKLLTLKYFPSFPAWRIVIFRVYVDGYSIRTFEG